MQKIELQRIAQHYRMDIPQRSTPQDEDVAHVVTARLTALLEADYRRLTGLQKERLKRFTGMAHDIANDEDQVALIAMLLDAHYQQTLHDAPPLPKPEVREVHDRQQPRQARQERQGRGQRQDRQGRGQRQEPREDRPRDDRPRRDTERDSRRNSPRNAERGHGNRQYEGRNDNLEADRYSDQNERRANNERRSNDERPMDDNRPRRQNRRAPRHRKPQGERSE